MQWWSGGCLVKASLGDGRFDKNGIEGGQGPWAIAWAEVWMAAGQWASGDGGCDGEGATKVISGWR